MGCPQPFPGAEILKELRAAVWAGPSDVKLMWNWHPGPPSVVGPALRNHFLQYHHRNYRPYSTDIVYVLFPPSKAFSSTEPFCRTCCSSGDADGALCGFPTLREPSLIFWPLTKTFRARDQRRHPSGNRRRANLWRSGQRIREKTALD